MSGIFFVIERANGYGVEWSAPCLPTKAWAEKEAERLNTMHRYYEKLVTKLDRLVTEIEDMQQDYPQEVTR